MREKGWRPRIRVIRHKQSGMWFLRWHANAYSKRWKYRNSGIPLNRPKSEAERAAARLEDELAALAGREPIRWEAAAERYERLHIDQLEANSQRNWRTARNHLERVLNPEYLVEIDEAGVDELSVTLRRSASPATVAGHLRYIRAFLKWAVRKRLIEEMPAVDMPKGAASKKRARDIVLEEFERILEAAPTVRPRNPGQWVRLLWGLWLTGFRISELLRLHWTDGPIRVDLSRKRPGFAFEGEQKNHKVQWVPMTPAFHNRFIHGQRPAGFLFPIEGKRGRQAKPSCAVKAIGELGRAAGVITGENQDGSPRYATSADIGRRAFATLWADALSPRELADLMRHSDPKTTFGHYVGDKSLELADKLWSAER